MPQAIIHLAPNELAMEIWRRALDDYNLEVVKKRLPEFTKCKPIEVEVTGLDAAEEMFDLTNNPSRQEEREEKYGRGRSPSVGDVVEVDGEFFLCQSVGWAKL